VGFEQLPDHILLKIFRSVEAVPDSTWGSEDSAGAPYGHVTDDTEAVWSAFSLQQVEQVSVPAFLRVGALEHWLS